MLCLGLASHIALSCCFFITLLHCFIVLPPCVSLCTTRCLIALPCALPCYFFLCYFTTSSRCFFALLCCLVVSLHNFDALCAASLLHWPTSLPRLAAIVHCFASLPSHVASPCCHCALLCLIAIACCFTLLPLCVALFHCHHVLLCLAAVACYLPCYHCALPQSTF